MNPIGHPKLDPLLQALRDTLGAAAARGTADMTAVDRVFTRFGEQLGVVLDEHAGMTDELLRAYEQLGIVFEVTRKLSTVQTERQVVRLFVDSLRITYSDHAVCLAIGQSDDSLRWLDPPPHTAAIEPVVRASAGTGKITVSPLAGIERAELMVAPIFSGSEFFGAIVITHDGNTRAFEASDMSLVEALTLFCGDILRNYQLANELRRLSVDMVRALVNAIDQKDEYTSGHSNRVGYFATLLGRELGLDEQELQMLEWAALLHDVGKIGIRDDVLKKPGKLTPEEFEHIKEHPVRSYEVVRDIPQLKAALDGVRHHHEHWNGRGYPDGLAGDAIPKQARIIQIADVFDALTTSRSYRKAFSWEKAMNILREEAGTVVDPQLVPVFERLIEREINEQRLTAEGQIAGATIGEGI